MKDFLASLINKNLVLQYKLKKRIGKRWARKITIFIDKILKRFII